MTGLVGVDGKPISSKTYNKKASPPPLGENFGSWAGEDISFLRLPGGGALQFDLSSLQLSDFRQMKDHYQINSSLSVLTFLLHQMEWRVTCSNKQQQAMYQENMEEIWTRLVRSLSQAFWAGYSPNVLQWDNDTQGRRIVLDKIKDLVPEDSRVKWKKVEASPPGSKSKHYISIYDGIKNVGSPDIPVECSFWYPLLMENGDYYGKKLLRPAFQSWFFSILLHLFANRYYERFGEPTPVGRAPYDDTVTIGGKEMAGNNAMEIILTQLRNRSAVVLPADRTPAGDESNPGFDYQIEYLESQMRGADFERYMTRLDEEMSLALFTPILLMRTADVGSYNLGTQHSIIYQWMLNAIAGDWKQYIDKYILRPLRDYNYGTKAELPKIQFRRMGSQNEELVRDIVRALISKGTLKPSVEELGEQAGLTLTEVKELTSDEPDTPGDPTQPSQADKPDNLFSVADRIVERVATQANNAFKKGNLEDFKFSIGYNKQFELALEKNGHRDASRETAALYAKLERFLNDLQSSSVLMETPDQFVRFFREGLMSEIESLV